MRSSQRMAADGERCSGSTAGSRPDGHGGCRRSVATAWPTSPRSWAAAKMRARCTSSGSPSTATAPRLPADRPDVITIGGLRPEYVNNAIAGVRLSSLPTIVWWRGGRPEGLDGVASLADRVVLDADDPWPLWARTPPLFEHTVLTDIRWARLTRWRAALAHFFDLPAVRETATTFSACRSPRRIAPWRRSSPAGSTRRSAGAAGSCRTSPTPPAARRSNR